MDNAFENENLEEVQGQIVDNVGQDVGQTQGGAGSGDWENQAKYFQSQKDKLHTENQKLRQYEQIGQMLESRPDIVQTITGMVQNPVGQPAVPERVTMGKDEFDPWAAYNDPASKSYQFRQQEMQESINYAVEGQLAGVQRQVGITELKSRLKNKGLNDQQINSFMEFANRNPADYGVDGAINMWKSMVPQQRGPGRPPKNRPPVNPMSNVRKNVGAPQQAGVLNGQQPVRKNKKDSMWDAITNSGSRANVL